MIQTSRNKKNETFIISTGAMQNVVTAPDIADEIPWFAKDSGE